MEENKKKIKVLWIDDNPDQFDEFLDDAFDAGLDIEVYKTVDAGLNALQDRNKIYEAIILDANCKISDEATEAPALVALSHAIVGIYANRIDLPWFVYTGGGYEGEKALEHIIPQQRRIWDDKIWYEKPDQEYELFEAIIRAVGNSESHKLMLQFPEAFEICHSQKLLDLLRERDTLDFQRDEDVPNSLRCVADKVCFYMRDKHLYPTEFQTSNLIKECSMVFGKDYTYQVAPPYIQYSFRFLSEYCNAGSHETDDAAETQKANIIKSDIKGGKAKYLNRAALHSLMTIIQWVTNFPLDDSEAMKPITLLTYEFKTEVDKKGKDRRDRNK